MLTFSATIFVHLQKRLTPIKSQPVNTVYKYKLSKSAPDGEYRWPKQCRSNQLAYISTQIARDVHVLNGTLQFLPFTADCPFLDS